MQTPDSRVAFIVRGVVQQVMRDSGRNMLRLLGETCPESDLIERWCGIRFSRDATALTVSPATKTALLLAGVDQPVDLTPLGDLYLTEAASFHRAIRPAGSPAEFAKAAGGIEIVDDCLRRLLDERRDADAAFAAVPHLREPMLLRMTQTRFRRARAGIIPKIGPRTVGIDLFI
jgi:hypothetical protein